jgi:hypothetical protein
VVLLLHLLRRRAVHVVLVGASVVVPAVNKHEEEIKNWCTKRSILFKHFLKSVCMLRYGWFGCGECEQKSKKVG